MRNEQLIGSWNEQPQNVGSAAMLLPLPLFIMQQQLLATRCKSNQSQHKANAATISIVVTIVKKKSKQGPKNSHIIGINLIWQLRGRTARSERGAWRSQNWFQCNSHLINHETCPKCTASHKNFRLAEIAAGQEMAARQMESADASSQLQLVASWAALSCAELSWGSQMQCQTLATICLACRWEIFYATLCNILEEPRCVGNVFDWLMCRVEYRKRKVDISGRRLHSKQKWSQNG